MNTTRPDIDAVLLKFHILRLIITNTREHCPPNPLR